MAISQDNKNVEEDKFEIDFLGFFRRNKVTGTINFISWVMMVFAASTASILFFVLNKAVIEGKENIPKSSKNVILASNHTSYAFDSFFIGIVACLPVGFFKGFALPYHPTSYGHYHTNKLIAFICAHLRCIPVKRKWKNEGGIGEKAGVFDEEGVELTKKALKQGMVIYFPEGTRTKDGLIHEGKPGAGMLPYETRATVIPVRIENINKLPSFGLKLKVKYGKPVYLDDLYDLPQSKETSKLIIDRIMGEIKAL